MEGLLTDTHRAMQLTTYTFRRVVSFILELGNVPRLLVGGGGYHAPSTAKHFTLLTALVLGKEVDEDIPVEAEYWEELEKDGGIHVGRDLRELNADGECEVELLCTTLKQKLEESFN
jgi:acetoin utilization deacetylase AcuC-like enzyme